VKPKIEKKLKSKMADGGHLENQKITIRNRLANFDEILHDSTYYSSRDYQLIKKSNF